MIKNVRLQTLKGIGKARLEALYGSAVYWYNYEGVHEFHLVRSTKSFVFDENDRRKRKEGLYASKEDAEIAFMRKVELLGTNMGFNIKTMILEYKRMMDTYPEHHI